MKAFRQTTLVLVIGCFVIGCGAFDAIFGPTGFTIRTTFVTPPSPTQRAMESPV